jgi:hypothetical protein
VPGGESNPGFGDFYWFGCEPPEDSGLHPAEETAKLVVNIVARRIPARFGLDPVRDVQVLTPMHRGPAGGRIPPEGCHKDAKILWWLPARRAGLLVIHGRDATQITARRTH